MTRAKKAIVLLNMGGPNNLEEVELFLKNMFDDENILTTKSKLLRKFIASMIIFSRVDEAQAVYEELGGKSPLVGYTQELVEKLQNKVSKEVVVDFAMRYTPPFASDIVQRLEDEDIKDIYLIPLYPQYSTTTTKSSIEDFIEAYNKTGGNATIHTIQNFYRNEKYNQVIINKILEVLGNENINEYNLIFSAHGLPQKIIDNGDPYEHQIKRHVKLLTDMLQASNVEFKTISLAYQSKVGPMKWLEPSLDENLKEFESQKVVIFPIAFTIDNSETEYELHKEYKAVAESLNISEYKVARCANSDDLFVDALVDIFMEM